MAIQNRNLLFLSPEILQSTLTKFAIYTTLFVPVVFALKSYVFVIIPFRIDEKDFMFFPVRNQFDSMLDAGRQAQLCLGEFTIESIYIFIMIIWGCAYVALGISRPRVRDAYIARLKKTGISRTRFAFGTLLIGFFNVLVSSSSHSYQIYKEIYPNISDTMFVEVATFMCSSLVFAVEGCLFVIWWVQQTEKSGE